MNSTDIGPWVLVGVFWAAVATFLVFVVAVVWFSAAGAPALLARMAAILGG